MRFDRFTAHFGFKARPKGTGYSHLPHGPAPGIVESATVATFTASAKAIGAVPVDAVMEVVVCTRAPVASSGSV